jgi:adenosylcobinamide-GDP ribazoletransferase
LTGATAADRGAVGAHPLGDAALALAFLTIVPVRTRHGDLGRAAAYFPLVGALVGGLAGGTRAAAQPLFGAAAATVLGMIVLVAVTGALHQDGLADTADGLGVRSDRDRRLAVMRDSSIGTFGTLALIAWSLLLFGALEPLTQAEGTYALIAAGAIGRWAAVVHGRGARPARRDGLGATFTPRWSSVAIATILAVTAAAVSADPVAAAAALGAGALAAVASIAFARRMVGGRTGDTLGAAVCLAEGAACLALVAVWT